jgi:hypothetical protein
MKRMGLVWFRNRAGTNFPRGDHAGLIVWPESNKKRGVKITPRFDEPVSRKNVADD